MLLAAYKALSKPLNLPWEYEEMKSLVIAGIKRQNAEVISNNELGNLWNAMTYLYEEGMIFGESDFKVKYMKTLKTDRVEREFKTQRPILMLRLNHFIGQYKRMARQQGDTVMSKDSIRYYLTTSSAYLGMKASERFTVYQDGHPVIAVHGSEDGGKASAVCKFDRCMCFDYQTLHEKFDLNLESVSAEMADVRESEQNEKEENEIRSKKYPQLFGQTDEDTDEAF